VPIGARIASGARTSSADSHADDVRRDDLSGVRRLFEEEAVRCFAKELNPYDPTRTVRGIIDGCAAPLK
jgi:hypothetical protein